MTGRIVYTPEAQQQLNELDDIRPGMRTTTLTKKTLVAYEMDESSDELVVNVFGVFHGGQDWESALSESQSDPEAGR